MFVGVYQTGQARMAMVLYYYKGDCTTPAAQAQIKQNFIRILNGSFHRDICRDPAVKDKCRAENVKVTCAQVASIGKRKKRASGRLLRIHLSSKKISLQRREILILP